MRATTNGSAFGETGPRRRLSPIDPPFELRKRPTGDAARHDGTQLSNLVSTANTAGDVWADTAYRSKQNGQHLADNGFRFRIHRKKPDAPNRLKSEI